MNTAVQYYKGISITLINRDYEGYNAKRYLLGHSNQNVWIPNKYLQEDGTLKESSNLDFVFRKASIQNKLRYANLRDPYKEFIIK